MFEAAAGSSYVASFYRFLVTELELMQLGVDAKRYRKFKEYRDCIPKEYTADKRYTLSLCRSLTTDDAEFCYHFAADVAMKWQNEALPPAGLAPGLTDWTLVHRINGVVTTVGPDWSGPERNQTVELIHVDAKAEAGLRELQPGKTYDFETRRYEAGVLTLAMSCSVKLLSIDFQLLVNNPARWEVVLCYSRSPLTWRRIDYAGGEIVSDTLCINTASVEELVTECPCLTRDEAEMLVDFRETNGPFEVVDDLLSVPWTTSEQHQWLSDYTRARP